MPTVAIPRIETARLVLRGHAISDLEECAAMWADPIVTRYIGGRPFSREEVWARLLRYAGHWLMLGYGYWVVRERDTQAFVGEVGFSDFRREMTPPIDVPSGGVPEVGWALANTAHGRGLATEAVAAAVKWLDGSPQFAVAQTVCIIHPDNVASQRVAQKCGYAETSRAIYEGEPTLLYARGGRVA